MLRCANTVLLCTGKLSVSPPLPYLLQHGAAGALAAALHRQAVRKRARGDRHGAARAGMLLFCRTSCVFCLGRQAKQKCAQGDRHGAARAGVLLFCRASFLFRLCILRPAIGPRTKHNAVDQTALFAPACNRPRSCLPSCWVLSAFLAAVQFKTHCTLSLHTQTQELLAKLLGADNPDVRAAAVFTLGALIQASDSGGLGGLAGMGGSSGALAGAAASAASLSPGSSAAGSMPGPAGAGPEAAAAAAAGAPAAASDGPLPDVDRLAIERAIACALLEVVYDASPTVR